MVTIAARLGELRERVVFLGGAVLGLLVDTPVGVRHTDDVDVVIDIRSQVDRVALDQQGRLLGHFDVSGVFVFDRLAGHLP
jgi:hypothetical protein